MSAPRSLAGPTGPIGLPASSDDGTGSPALGVPDTSTRLAALDGFRAVAVIWVAAYHYLYFWTPAGAGTDLIAYGDAYAAFPFASVGFLGVHLFFMVSGFVILMTLERMPTLRAFFIGRLIRLWPPLLILGTLTFVLGHAFGPPEFAASWAEYLLSLVVLPPEYVGRIVGETGWRWLDGAYWSLWVEAKFYVLIGVLFYLGRGRIVRLWTLFELAAMAIGVCSLLSDSAALGMLNGFIFQKYLPYFSFGLAGYLAFTGRSGQEVRCLVVVALLHVTLGSALDLSGPLGDDPQRSIQFVAGQVLLFWLFYAFAWRRRRLRILTSAILTGPGRASYGTYLVHQNIGVIVLSQSWATGDRLGPLAPVLVLVGAVAFAILFYRHLEQPLQAALKRALARSDRGAPISSSVADSQRVPTGGHQ